MALEDTLLKWLIQFIIFAISALPLYFAVSIFRKKVSFLKVLLVAFATGILVSAVHAYFHIWGTVIAFFLLIWIYREVFRLKWLNALLAWFLQILFIIIFNILIFLVSMFLGVSIPYLF